MKANEEGREGGREGKEGRKKGGNQILELLQDQQLESAIPLSGLQVDYTRKKCKGMKGARDMNSGEKERIRIHPDPEAA